MQEFLLLHAAPKQPKLRRGEMMVSGKGEENAALAKFNFNPDQTGGQVH
ncbi:hypothetical protein [Cohaesibacter intestini]|nr:hypothetical protein [Cohaesibacter intestini]